MQIPKINSERWLNPTDLEGEIWRAVVGYEGLYSVSNYGRIKTHKRKFDGILRCLPNKLNYTFVCLCKKGEVSKRVGIHRIVAKAFLPNPCGYPEINHKDETPSNNCVDNLEWCTRRYNNNYGGRRARQSATMIAKCTLGKPIHQYDLDGTYIASYRSMKEAERNTSIHSTNIGLVANRGSGSAGGFMWSWDLVERMPKYHFANGHIVYQYDMNWNFIAKYESARLASKAVHGAKKANTIIGCCQGKYSQAHGYRWSYEKI